MTLIDQFLNARKFGVPLLGIDTPDQAATVQSIVKAINGKNKEAILCWDIVRGPQPCNEPGKQALYKLTEDDDAAKAELFNPTSMLAKAASLGEKSILCIYNAHRYYDNEAVMQAMWNLRDVFKQDGRTLVLLGPTLKLPIELERDVILFDEPLPTDEELGDIIKGVHTYADLPEPKAEQLTPLVKAARGLAPFATEQACALSLTKEGANVQRLWDLKRKMIEQTRGLQMFNQGDTFEDIGGIARIKQYASWLFKGPEAPACIVWVDEIEKAMSGTAGDTSGTSQDQLGALLSAMEDNTWNGLIALGPPGCAKSMFAKSMPLTYGAPCIRLDMGALKGSLVGQSEAQMRNALKVIKSVAGKNAYWVATCNKLENLPPELRRRFTDGIWFFDLPDAEEREKIWKVCSKKFNVKKQAQPEDDNWTGADIRNVCSIAYRLGISLVEASTFITPVAKSDPQSIERLRKLADGAFLSASYSGVYSRSEKEKTPRRKMEV